MMDTEWLTLNSVVLVLLALHCLGLFMAMYRVLRGPDLSNRLVGLEYIGLNALSFLALYCLLAEDPVYLDVGIVLALITFLSTVSLARYIERGAQQE